LCPEGVTQLLPEGKPGEICLPEGSTGTVPSASRREAGGLSPVLPEVKNEAKRKQKERPPASWR